MSLKLYYILWFICVIPKNNSLKFSSLDKIYNKGVSAYTNERWSDCIVQFEELLHLFKVYNSINNNCRLKCKTNVYDMVYEELEDIKIFQKFFNKRDCLIHCQRVEFEEVRMYHNVTDTVLSNLQERKPYAYLHMCYFQMNALPKAASAAFTYHVAHPDDIASQENVKYYVEQPEVDAKEVTDLERKDYQILYQLGVNAYANKKWGETIANMEEVITDYLSWEGNCRVACEKQPIIEESTEFVISVSNKMASLLACSQKCQDDLKLLYNSGTEFLADVLNYLQISYYNSDRIEDAAKVVASYLILLPNDEDMMENKKIYLTLVDKKKFTERSDISYYYKRDKYEKQLLDFFHKENSNY